MTGDAVLDEAGATRPRFNLDMHLSDEATSSEECRPINLTAAWIDGKQVARVLPIVTERSEEWGNGVRLSLVLRTRWALQG
jgi:hypothetical protein